MKSSPPDKSGLQDGVATNGGHGPSKETSTTGDKTALNETQDSGAKEAVGDEKKGMKPIRQVKNQAMPRRGEQEPRKTTNPDERSDGEATASVETGWRVTPSLRIGSQCEESRRRPRGRKRRRRGTIERTWPSCLELHSNAEQLSWYARGG